MSDSHKSCAQWDIEKNLFEPSCNFFFFTLYLVTVLREKKTVNIQVEFLLVWDDSAKVVPHCTLGIIRSDFFCLPWNCDMVDKCCFFPLFGKQVQTGAGLRFHCRTQTEFAIISSHLGWDSFLTRAVSLIARQSTFSHQNLQGECRIPSSAT